MNYSIIDLLFSLIIYISTMLFMYLFCYAKIKKLKEEVNDRIAVLNGVITNLREDLYSLESKISQQSYLSYKNNYDMTRHNNHERKK